MGLGFNGLDFMGSGFRGFWFGRSVLGFLGLIGFRGLGFRV